MHYNWTIGQSSGKVIIVQKSAIISGLPHNICSPPATCLLSNAILMHPIHLLISSPECSYVKTHMHARIVKKHFIRGDPSLSLSGQMLFLRFFYLLKWDGVCMYMCVTACLHTPTTSCFPGDTQLRVLGGWQRDGRGGGRMGGVAMERVAWGTVEWVRYWEVCEARPGGWHGSGASLCPGHSCPSLSLLRTASAACFTCKTHPAERASTHGAKGTRRKAFLRQCWEKREGVSSTASLYQCLPQMKPWGDAVIRDERINSLQIILL